MAYYYRTIYGDQIQILPPGGPGVLGSYIWAVNTIGSAVPYGGAINGSALSSVYMQITADNPNYNWSGTVFMNNTYYGGTWMNVGPEVPGAELGYYCISLWVRIA